MSCFLIRYGHPKPEFSTAGFSLPELLVTLLLISVLFTLGLIFSTGLRQTRHMRDYEIAIALARQAIEVLRAAPFELIDEEDAAENSSEYDLNNSSGPEDLLQPEFNVNNIKYTRKVEVKNVPSPDPAGTPLGLKHVKVTVLWTTIDGKEVPPYEITTTIANMN